MPAKYSSLKQRERGGNASVSSGPRRDGSCFQGGGVALQVGAKRVAVVVRLDGLALALAAVLGEDGGLVGRVRNPRNHKAEDFLVRTARRTFSFSVDFVGLGMALVVEVVASTTWERVVGSGDVVRLENGWLEAVWSDSVWVGSVWKEGAELDSV